MGAFRFLFPPIIVIGLFFSGCSKNDGPTGNSTPDPVASFIWTGQTVAPAVITFQNTSQNANSYRWEFGDGDTSTATSPRKTYAAGGTYTIRLTANNTATAKSSLATQQIVITNLPSADLFSLPTTVGTRWTYRYSYSYGDDRIDHHGWRSGTWVWEITSASLQHDTITCIVQSTAVDSVHELYGLYSPPLDSRYVDTVRSSWSYVTTPTDINLDWVKLTRTPRELGDGLLRTISRSTVADTLNINTHEGPVIYYRDVGLITYVGTRWMMSYQGTETLTLIDKDIK